MEQYPNLENLALFVKVVEAGSFTRVSEKFRIPKASLSRRINQLEEFYGTQLLLRNTRHLQVTEMGRELLNRAQLILSLSEEVHTLMSQKQEGPRGLLRITAGVEYGLSVLSPIACAYMKAFPDVAIELDLTGRLVDLVYEGFDLAVRIGPLDNSTLSMKKIGSFRYGLFAAPQLLKKYPKLSIDQLHEIPALAFTRAETRNIWRLQHKSETRELELIPRFASNNYFSLMQAAAAGYGVVYMPHFLAKDELKAGRLLPLLPNWMSEEIPIHFLYPSQRFLHSKLRTFIDFAVEALS